MQNSTKINLKSKAFCIKRIKEKNKEDSLIDLDLINHYNRISANFIYLISTNKTTNTN